MVNAPEIRLRSWVRANAAEQSTGLLAYVSVLYGTLILDSIVVRRTSQGRLALSFPARTAKNGERHPFIRPLNDEVRRSIEKELLSQLRQRANLSFAEGEHP